MHDIDTSHKTQCGTFYRSCIVFHSFPAKYDGLSTVHSNSLRVLCKPFSKSSANSPQVSAVCLKNLQSPLLRIIFILKYSFWCLYMLQSRIYFI
jgi:hypothetical protein